MSALLAPLQDGIALRATLEACGVGLVAGPLGVWILLMRQAYAAESISHAMLPGLVLAALAGASLLIGALVGVLVAAALIALAERDRRLGPEIGVAVTVTTLFGLGAMLATLPDAPARVGELLFGDLLGVGDTDLAAAAALIVFVGGALAVSHRSLAVAALDPLAAPSLGVSPPRAALVLLVLLALTTAAAAQGLGTLLLLALIVGPAAGALALTRRLVPALALAALLAVLAGLVGMEASYHLRSAAGASVALAALMPVVLAAPVAALARRRDLRRLRADGGAGGRDVGDGGSQDRPATAVGPLA